MRVFVCCYVIVIAWIRFGGAVFHVVAVRYDRTANLRCELRLISTERSAALVNALMSHNARVRCIRCAEPNMACAKSRESIKNRAAGW